MWIIPKTLQEPRTEQTASLSKLSKGLLFDGQQLKTEKLESLSKRKNGAHLKKIQDSQPKDYKETTDICIQFASAIKRTQPKTPTRPKTKYLSCNSKTWAHYLREKRELHNAQIKEQIAVPKDYQIVLSSKKTLVCSKSKVQDLTFSKVRRQKLSATESTKPNSRWIEVLMGLPIGWVNPLSENVYFVEARFNALDPQTQPPFKNLWATPRATQRGDSLRFYLKRCITRAKENKFSPMLQNQLEAAERELDITAFINTHHQSKNPQKVVDDALNQK